MFKDPQVKHRKMIINVNNKKAGISKAIGMPIKFSHSKTKRSTGAPVFGQHTKEILLDFGFTKQEINKLVTNKIVYSADK